MGIARRHVGVWNRKACRMLEKSYARPVSCQLNSSSIGKVSETLIGLHPTVTREVCTNLTSFISSLQRRRNKEAPRTDDPWARACGTVSFIDKAFCRGHPD